MIRFFEPIDLATIQMHHEPFLVNEKVVVSLHEKTWTMHIAPFGQPYIKKYEEETIDFMSYITEPNKTIFVYETDGLSVGHIRLSVNWNGYGLIENIAVKSSYRRQGIGKELLDKAKDWAANKQLYGLMLETQDINVPACMMYRSAGFKLGGADTMLYSADIHPDISSETALTFYYPL